MTTCCSILAWRIPWTEEPGRLQSIGFQRFGHKRSDLVHTHHLTYFSFSFSFSFSFFFLVRTFKFYSLGKLQLYHTVLSTIVTMLYQILRFYFYSLTAESLYPLTNLSLFPPTPGPGNNFCFYEFGFFFFIADVGDVCVCVFQSLPHVRFFATPWTLACQIPLSLEFSRQEYWSGQSFPSPGDLPDPGIKPRSPALQADPLLSEPPGNCEIFVFFCLAYFSQHNALKVHLISLNIMSSRSIYVVKKQDLLLMVE